MHFDEMISIVIRAGVDLVFGKNNTETPRNRQKDIACIGWLAIILGGVAFCILTIAFNSN